MDTEMAIAIITAGAALATSIIGIIFNVFRLRKENVQKFVLKNRINYLAGIRKGFTDIIGLSNSDAIRLARSRPEVMLKFTERLFTGYGRIKTYIKPFYDMDRELLASLDLLYNRILAELNGDEPDGESIDALRESFADKYLKYDWAYWKYIQSQRDGNYIDSDKAFDDIYNSFVKEIEGKSTPSDADLTDGVSGNNDES